LPVRRAHLSFRPPAQRGGGISLWLEL